MDAGRGPDRLTIVEQPPRPPTTFYSTSMDGINPQQQHRAGYGDLCRAQGPTDTLSAAYHSRYLASLPALTSTSGCNFPFLNNMFASGPTSPFRAPSAPGIGNCSVNGTTNPMRQQLFWPPTPPPDGYGRYGLNTSLFPLFGSVSPSPADGGAAAAAYMLSQGLVSRHLTPCTSTTVSSSHHLLDPHKDQGFFSSGFGLASPLTPSSQLSATNPFSHHLIPPPHPLDFNKYPSTFCPAAANSTNTKDFVSDDSKSHHHHHHSHQTTNCQSTVKSENSNSPATTTTSSVRHSQSTVTTSAKPTKSDKKTSSHTLGHSKHTDDVKPKKNIEEASIKQYQQSRQSQPYFMPSKDCPPFEIDIICEPSIKPDILSPPIESPSGVVSPYQEKRKHLVENSYLSCANNSFEKNDIPKVEEVENDEENIVIDVDNDESKKSSKDGTDEDAVPSESLTTVMERPDDADSGDSSNSSKNVSSVCPLQNSNFECEKSLANLPITNVRTDVNAISVKHITAAVIPTAPKQQHIGNFNHNRTDNLTSTPFHLLSSSESESKSTCPTLNESPMLTVSALSKIKIETTECIESSLPVIDQQTMSLNCCKNINVSNKNVCTKVKDMIKVTDCSTKQNCLEMQQVALTDKVQISSPSTLEKLSDSVDKPFQAAASSVAKLYPVIPEKAIVQGKVQAFDTKKKIIGPLKTESPVYKVEPINTDFSEKTSVTNLSKATVTPFNFHQKEEDQQAINLTICKKKVEAFSPVPFSENSTPNNDSISSIGAVCVTPNSCKTPIATECNVPTANAVGATSCCVPGTGVIGVCHPNVSKGKVFVGSSLSKFSAVTSVTSQMDVSNDGEVHVASLTKSSTFQTLNTAAATCLNRAASVTGFQNTKTQVKTERLTPNIRTKNKDNEKIISATGKATALATLAPKLAKKVGFLKDTKSSHTLSTSSSVSSTSIVFPATVNPCIPVGIAIAQQRQDTSATAAVGKNQSGVPPTNSGIVSASHLSTTRVTTEIQQPQEIIREQKPQEIGCPNSTVSTDSANFLVTQGPTIVSRQWESEAVTRATLPSPWVAHGSIVAPALWIGQGATATAAYATTAPASTPQLPAPLPTPVNSLETPPISLPPGGYQLARDSVTGHLFLIPAANIVDRTAMWPSYGSAPGNTLPVQQLVTQQHHTQFEQVLPQVSEQEHIQDCLAFSVQQTHIGEATKDVRVDSCCDSTGAFKTAEIQTIKTEEKDGSNHVPPVPLASGQTFTFTTFPTACDPPGFSYVLQSSTVMHLAHTAQATSIQAESGKRSQGTSPLHPASPSPSPCCQSSCANIMSENEECEEEEHEDSDGAASMDSTQVKLSQPTQSVTTAVQVDMDSRTNSEVEEDEEEEKNKNFSIESEQIKMSDSAIQTECGLSDSGKDDSEPELPVEEIKASSETEKATVIPKLELQTCDSLSVISDSSDTKNGQRPDSPCKIIITEEEEEEIAPSLPVESKPVRDFIDHHGLDLLVDSIEEFASRERDETKEMIQQDVKVESNESEQFENHLEPTISEKKILTPPLRPTYNPLDASSCTDGLGLLCALAEQRFFEEALHTEDDLKANQENSSHDCYSFPDEDDTALNVNIRYSSPKKENPVHQRSASSPPSFQQVLNGSIDEVPSSNLQACEKEMRKRLADLQRKFKKKQLQLAQLMPDGDSDDPDIDSHTDDEIPARYQRKKIFTLPRLKHKSITNGKYYNRLPTHSYKIIAQRLASNRIHLAHSRKKSNFKKLNQNRIKEPELISTIHSKNSSTKDSESENKIKKMKKSDVVQKHSEEKKLKIVKKSDKTSQGKHKSENSSAISQKEKSTENTSKQKIVKSENKHVKKIKIEKVKSSHNTSEGQQSQSNKKRKLDDHKIGKSEKLEDKDKSKIPFFDEQAWFVRRSERIFLSDARPPSLPQNPSSSAMKKVNTCQSNVVQKSDSKEKKENIVKSVTKGSESKIAAEKDKDNSGKLMKTKQKHKLPDSLNSKKRISMSSSSSKSSDVSSSSADSDSSSDEEENVKFSATTKTQTPKEKSKKIPDESSGNSSSNQLIHSPSNEFLKSCILNISTLVDNTRVLILDEGLFYAGHIIHVQAPDVYGIVLDGERAHRPHIFSREEILIATVLEVKPTDTSQIPEGSRVCAYWSQQYRCLYPGTVAKASSPLPDPSLLYVEFDDGDSGRISLNDIRILPPDFPIVSTEPNPLLLLGKRRAHIGKDYMRDQKDHTMDKTQQKENPKLKKKRADSCEERQSRDLSKSEHRSSSSKKISSNGTSKLDASVVSLEKARSKKLKTDKEESTKKKKPHSRDSSLDDQLRGKKRKKHHDEHKHHHKHKHHHHKHHHKKHKLSHSSESPDESSEDVSIKSPLCSPKHEGELIVEKTSDLTVTIKTSPSPHTMHTHGDQHMEVEGGSCKRESSSSSESSDNEDGEDKTNKVKRKTKVYKKKKDASENKPAKKKERVPSVEKSKIAAFLPVRQLWRWSGKGFRRPGAKGKGKKEFYRAIQRGKELLRVGDCAVFLSTGRPHLPYIGRIETMWESWGGKMDVKVKWFYHPEETKSSKKLTQLKGALFQSPHFDENDVQTISHKCEVISWEEYQQTKAKDKSDSSLFDNNDTYYLAGTYDPYTGTLSMEPGIPKIPGITAPEK